MTANEFKNALLLLGCIDADEFAALGDMESIEGECDWSRYCKDPVKFYIHAGGEQRNALWAIIQTRLKIGDANDTDAS